MSDINCTFVKEVNKENYIYFNEEWNEEKE